MTLLLIKYVINSKLISNRRDRSGQKNHRPVTDCKVTERTIGIWRLAGMRMVDQSHENRSDRTNRCNHDFGPIDLLHLLVPIKNPPRGAGQKCQRPHEAAFGEKWAHEAPTARILHENGPLEIPCAE